ncbi:unnamed protein product [Enterobius vermicularis]|uniref:AMP-binding_C domain-containing protein n=1 Tax=Enterobius vermicularis TaxID=51028 RepID=A0A0N4VQ06_ENTVE|nr:unnamed protein product [Enterobius vermicularis]
MPYVENVCVCANQMRDYVVALIVPRQEKLFELARTIGINETNFENLCKNEVLKNELLKELNSYCNGKLHKMEIPRKIHLCHEIWAPNSGLVTAAFKVRRKRLEKQFQKEIEAMYL